MASNIRPRLQAILVADHVYQDIHTGKAVIAGVFHEINLQAPVIQEVNEGTKKVTVAAPTGGFQMGSPFVYISLVDVSGDQQFSLRYVNLKTDAIIFTAQFVIASKDRLVPSEVVLPLPMLTQIEGVYALELLWHDEPLGSFRITVQRKSASGEIIR